MKKRVTTSLIAIVAIAVAILFLLKSFSVKADVPPQTNCEGIIYDYYFFCTNEDSKMCVSIDDGNSYFICYGKLYAI